MPIHHLKAAEQNIFYCSHGRRSRGDRGTSPLPPEFGAGDANTNCPPDFVIIGTKMSVLWPSKYAKIRFRPAPDPAEGAHDAPPDSLVG